MILPLETGSDSYTPMSEETFHHSLELIKQVKRIAKKRRAKPFYITLFLVHAQGEDVFPIQESKRVKCAPYKMGAVDIGFLMR